MDNPQNDVTAARADAASCLIASLRCTSWGDGLTQHDVMRGGDFIYVPAGVPHLPASIGSEPAFAVVARTDPSELESVELLPDLDELATSEAAL